jgi:hypothetical protein
MGQGTFGEAHEKLGETALALPALAVATAKEAAMLGAI